MPEDGELVLLHHGQVLGPEDLVGAAPAEPQRGADPVAGGAGGADAGQEMIERSYERLCYYLYSVGVL